MGQAFDFRYWASAEPNPMLMAEQIMQFAPASDAEALKLLRRSYPNCPLSARIAALDFLMRRKSRPHPRPQGSRP
jgi:hypothetical protein